MSFDHYLSGTLGAFVTIHGDEQINYVSRDYQAPVDFWDLLDNYQEPGYSFLDSQLE